MKHLLDSKEIGLAIAEHVARTLYPNKTVSIDTRIFSEGVELRAEVTVEIKEEAK
jgi:hypothetical protein